MAQATGCMSITSQSAPIRGLSCSVSVSKGLRTSFLPEEHHVCRSRPAQEVRTSERFLVRSNAGADSPAETESENSTHRGHGTQVAIVNNPIIARRELIGNAASLLLSSVAFPAIAASEKGSEDGFTLYQDDTDKYSLLVPNEWVKGEGNIKAKNSQRKVTAFYPESDSSANVNIVITGLAADFTSLGSFGTAEMFAENLVNSLDRSWQKPPGQKARLINESSRNGMYYLEYTIEKPGESQRHLLSVVGIASNGWYNRLYTVTAQYGEDDSDKYKERLKRIVSSFRLTG
ncbi:hypothetical protein R1sor_006280 [Riccia sorocarpa]|uniref:PsbP C-terminal domain-containing protein n=1 Tax=Riccia sorocarpa TaxID=122646 RepID=A0ABD3HTF9_9MARC